MTPYTGALLCLSIILSTGRNVFSKSISTTEVKTKAFYLYQTVIFVSGIIPMLLAGGSHTKVSTTTVVLAFLYGILLVSAQWNYTIALKSGNVGVCATVYSLGFILPTMSGMIFWNERVSIVRIIGILMVIPAIVISGKSKEQKNTEKGYFLPLIVAMISSGGLGIMQKIQQATRYAEEKNTFIMIAFITASLISLVFSFFTSSEGIKVTRKTVLSCMAIGLCFSICNLLNTILAGVLDSAIFFPMLNIGSILFSLLIGIIAFKECFKRRELWIVVIGITSIILINLG